MSVLRVVTLSIDCDHCTAWTDDDPNATTAREARANARTLGWQHRRSVGDMCPSCAAWARSHQGVPPDHTKEGP